MRARQPWPAHARLRNLLLHPTLSDEIKHLEHLRGSPKLTLLRLTFLHSRERHPCLIVLQPRDRLGQIPL